MKHFFVDESGTHTLDTEKLDPTFPFFVLTGIIFEEGEYQKFRKALEKTEKGNIYAEQRNSRLDKQFLLAWESAKLTVTGDGEEEDRMSKLKNHNISIPNIVSKSPENNGLELADLISYRIARVVQGKANKPRGNEIDINLILKKIGDIGSLPPDLDLKPLR